MLVENVIEQLQKFPKDTEVCLWDHRKNLADDWGEGSSSGIYSEFDISIYDHSEDEKKFLKETYDRDFKPWVAIGFNNEDYDDDGNNLLTDGIEEGSENWKAEYDNCRALLQELVELKRIKSQEGRTSDYSKRQPKAWEAANEFLSKYQHQ